MFRPEGTSRSYTTWEWASPQIAPAPSGTWRWRVAGPPSGKAPFSSLPAVAVIRPVLGPEGPVGAIVGEAWAESLFGGLEIASLNSWVHRNMGRFHSAALDQTFDNVLFVERVWVQR